MRKITDITYFNNLKLDFYLPDNKDFTTIVYFHGGGLVEGDKWDAWTLGEHFSSKGICLVSVDYSLYPNTKFPQYLIEAANAIKYAFEHIESYSGNKNKIFVGGSSAGAWITLMLCFDDKYLNAVGMDKKIIKGWISESAQPTSHFNVQKKEKNINPSLIRIDEYAPLSYIRENMEISPLFLMFYDDDISGRLEQNKLLFETIRNTCPTVNVQTKLMKGSHCFGSSYLVDGEYPFLVETMNWMDNLQKEKKNILMIGNSFAVDAARYVHDLSLGSDTELEVGVLYIGGCSLEKHVECLQPSGEKYEYYKNGYSLRTYSSLKEALLEKKWDYISFQQVSSYSGLKDTFYPYINVLIDYVRKFQSKTTLVLHQTWAYSKNSTHPEFVNYNNDQETMFKYIRNAYNEVADDININVIIKSGLVIQGLRNIYGDIFNKDGFHLTELGRYAAGLSFVLTFNKNFNSLFVPNEIDLSSKEAQVLLSQVQGILKKI